MLIVMMKSIRAKLEVMQSMRNLSNLKLNMRKKKWHPNTRLYLHFLKKTGTFLKDLKLWMLYKTGKNALQHMTQRDRNS